jgi:hypothetical protein
VRKIQNPVVGGESDRRIKSRGKIKKGQNNGYLKIDENKIKYQRYRYSGEFIVLSDMQ